MAVPKKKSSKTRTNRRYRTWVKKEQKRLLNGLVLVPYGRGGELKPAHIYLDDGGDLRKNKKGKDKGKIRTQGEPKSSKEEGKEKKSPVREQDSFGSLPKGTPLGQDKLAPQQSSKDQQSQASKPNFELQPESTPRQATEEQPLKKGKKSPKSEK